MQNVQPGLVRIKKNNERLKYVLKSNTLHGNYISTVTKPCLSITPIQLIGLILASVLLKAECICPTAKPKGRKDNTSKPVAQLLADFKEILWAYVLLRCLCLLTVKVTRVTLSVVLFMLLDFLLLKLFGALWFVPHLLPMDTFKGSTDTDTHTNNHHKKHVPLEVYYNRCGRSCFINLQFYYYVQLARMFI